VSRLREGVKPPATSLAADRLDEPFQAIHHGY
jgi:hypothetical protein